MTENPGNDGVGRNEAATIDFAQKYTESEQFKTLFREGMTLVEATAAYLDGDGRREARRLDQNTALAYARKSMRLTTRLMQLASWLLVRRAVSEGEMTPAEAQRQKNRVQLKPTDEADRSLKYEALPATFKKLIKVSEHLYNRIVKLDSMLNSGQKTGATGGESPLHLHITRLADSFKGGDTA